MRLLIPSACLLLLSALCPGASINWNAPATIASDADVSVNGSPVFAYGWNGSSQTVNGVAFTAVGSGVTPVWSSGASFGTFVSSAGATLPAGGLSTAYKSILDGGRYAATGVPCTVTLNNLVSGRNYEVQLWVVDSRTYGPARSETVSSGGNTVTLNYSNAAANVAGGVGQFTIGTFTANAATQTITLTGNASTQINAIQLRDLTPSPPAITAAPQSQSIALGDTVSLAVSVSGSGLLSYQWFHDDEPVDGATAATLVLTNVTATHAGDYTVTVTNPLDSVTSEAARITVVDPIDPAVALDLYNPIWNTPSGNDRGAMPIGNGEVGLMLWVEANGDLQFYLSRSDSRTELDRLVKLGKVRLNLSPNPFASGQPFRQELRLRDGLVEISAGPEASRVTLQVFVDSGSDTVHVKGSSAAPVTVRASYETWRTQDYTGNSGSSPLAGSGFPNLYESADVVDVSGSNHLAFYHRNAWSCVAQLAQVQFMTPYLADIPDPLSNLTFGGRMDLTGATVNGGSSLLTTAPVSSFDLAITTHAAQSASAAAWLGEVAAIKNAAPSATAALQRTEQWWHDYWNRSWLFTTGDGPPDAQPMGWNNLPLRLGADSNGGSPFSGAMARASFYQRVLTPAEITALATGAPDSDVTVINGLSASWLLGTTSGGVCQGRLGTGLDLTTTGTINPVPGGAVSHARFDGGHFQAPDDDRFEPAAGATMEAWVYLDAGEPNTGRLFDKVTANSQNGYLLDLYPGRALRFYNGFDLVNTGGNAIATGTWVHVVTTYDNVTKARAQYVNGSLVAQVDGSTPGSGEGTPSVVTRGYVLTKWMSACGARGNFPIMFNGSLWTVNPNTSPITISNNPDFRNWDHTYFYQNTRLNYLSMPARGELDFMQPFFDYYDRFQALNRGRAQAWHGAATEGQFNNEMTTSFGLTPGGIYGYNRSGVPNWWTSNRYGGALTISPGLELLAMMLDAYDHSGDTAFLQAKILPYAADLFRFIETRYPARIAGKVSMNPIQSLESFQDTTNSMPVVAGMTAVLDRILALPEGLLTPQQAVAFAASKAITPPLPLRTFNDKTIFAPAQAFSNSRTNVEEPEHYATYPFRLTGIGVPTNRLIANDTFEQISLGYGLYKPFVIGGPLYSHSFSGWQTTPLVASVLGRTDDAKYALTSNARLFSSGYRLPAMWGQIYDSVPDGDHGANVLNTAQFMAFQTMGEKIFLLPAWPTDWDVSFKFHAPRATVVSGRFRNGTLDQLEVTPPSRANDLVLMSDVPVHLSGSATVSAYDAQRLEEFSGEDLADPAAWAADADPDGDGLVNLIEYALGLDSLVGNPSPVEFDLATVGEETYLRLTVHRDPTASGVSIKGEATATLENAGSWSSSGLVVEIDTPTEFRVRDSVPASAGNRRFMRLRFSQP
ncbi:DUF5703 domain-containing protein [Luteolibacter arcticus]|uniref:DUF5703 domain-containing protein n=1 Tax=Luteolibacter arcticus TaxID=1581411 RepID=A0ABT3GLQ4_9BACT|nr:DUF5703 domain-containing protein [Luteolibacter arcticus]MCW1924432.1 DUF5703 domain-containing protein [Luteolibacter arcticus]